MEGAVPRRWVWQPVYGVEISVYRAVIDKGYRHSPVYPLSDTVIAMLPSLSKLSIGGVCPSCTAPTDAELLRWDMREELKADEFERIPMSYRSSRTECAICYNELQEPSPEDNKSMEVIVAVDSYGSCGHAFHQKCLQRWFDRQVSVEGTLTCPLCRQPFLDQKIDRLYDRIDGERPPPAPRDDDGDREYDRVQACQHGGKAIPPPSVHPCHHGVLSMYTLVLHCLRVGGSMRALRPTCAHDIDP